MKTFILATLFACLTGLSAAPALQATDMDDIGQVPYLPFIMRDILVGNQLGEFTIHTSYDDTLGYRAFEQGKVDNSTKLLIIDQRRGYMQVELFSGDSTLTLKLWAILKEGYDSSGQPLKPDQWLAAFTRLSCGTMNCGQSILFYRIYSGYSGVPYFEPVAYKDVLPVVTEKDFIKTAPGAKPCFHNQVNYLEYSLNKDSPIMKVSLLVSDGEYDFIAEGCVERIKTAEIELEWTGSKFKKGRAIPIPKK